MAGALRPRWEETASRRGAASRARRSLVVVLSVCLLSSVLAALAGAAAAQSVSDRADAASEVRIAARKLANGNIEFGLRLAGGDEWLPRARFFPYATVSVGRWLLASPYGMSDGNDVRIRARKLANGKAEFGLQVGESRVWVPRARNFPYETASVGRWLYSSWYTVGDATSPLGGGAASTTPTAPPRDRSACTFERSMGTILPSVFQLVTNRGFGTAFYVGNGEFVTAAHVLEGARTIRLQNHERTIRQVQVAGIDHASDVAILRADGTGIPAIRFGDESSLGRGARVAAVGYPGDNIDTSSGYPASIASGLLSSRGHSTDYDYVFYLRTDAAANRGNSGGPLIDACGDVLGLISWKIVGVGVEGLTWAISEHTIQEVMRRPRRTTGSPAGTDLGDWVLSRSADIGEPFLANVSRAYEYHDAPFAEDAPVIFVRCDSDELEAYVWWDTVIFADFRTEAVPVQFRFDDGRWISEGWYESTTYEAVFALHPRAFVDAARSADAVAIWVWNFDGSVVGSAVFALDGLSAGLAGIPCY